MPAKTSQAARPKQEAARKELHDRGFIFLWSTPSHRPHAIWIESWIQGSTVVYLLLYTNRDGWDLLASIDDTGGVAQTWEALDKLLV